MLLEILQEVRNKMITETREEIKKKADLMLTIGEPVFKVFCMIEEAGEISSEILSELFAENHSYDALKC